VLRVVNISEIRFELEQDIINGRIELKDLPERWNGKMHDYLGFDVPDDARGVLQDMHCGRPASSGTSRRTSSAP